MFSSQTKTTVDQILWLRKQTQTSGEHQRRDFSVDLAVTKQKRVVNSGQRASWESGTWSVTSCGSGKITGPQNENFASGDTGNAHSFRVFGPTTTVDLACVYVIHRDDWSVIDDEFRNLLIYDRPDDLRMKSVDNWWSKSKNSSCEQFFDNSTHTSRYKMQVLVLLKRGVKQMTPVICWPSRRAFGELQDEKWKKWKTTWQRIGKPRKAERSELD